VAARKQRVVAGALTVARRSAFAPALRRSPLPGHDLHGRSPSTWPRGRPVVRATQFSIRFFPQKTRGVDRGGVKTADPWDPVNLQPPGEACQWRQPSFGGLRNPYSPSWGPVAIQNVTGSAAGTHRDSRRDGAGAGSGPASPPPGPDRGTCGSFISLPRSPRTYMLTGATGHHLPLSPSSPRPGIAARRKRVRPPLITRAGIRVGTRAGGGGVPSGALLKRSAFPAPHSSVQEQCAGLEPRGRAGETSPRGVFSLPTGRTKLARGGGKSRNPRPSPELYESCALKSEPTQPTDRNRRPA
jgi:hypothetical protein